MLFSAGDRGYWNGFGKLAILEARSLCFRLLREYEHSDNQDSRAHNDMCPADVSNAFSAHAPAAKVWDGVGSPGE
jgi:hypothetical protein